MKKQFYLLFLSAILFSTIAVQANTITVKGHVTLINGSPSKNTPVNIAVYLINATASCSEQVAFTNNDGFYTMELTCAGGDIRRTRITVKNCDHPVLMQEKEVSSSKIVEANFSTACPATSTSCVAAFTAESVTASSTVAAFYEKFNAGISSTGSGDIITSRVWDFHDGAILTGNRVDPTHIFSHNGIYEVCLTIKTTSGCESKVCKQITVAAIPTVACSANFNFERLGPKKFRFNSSASEIAANDNVVERSWNFRDGTAGSEASPAHEFAKFGSYEVCLTIKTAKGCESRICKVVNVDENYAATNDPIIIVSLYPSPVHENLKSVIYSKNSNIAASVSIVNMDGVVQSVQQLANLSQGNNTLTINVFMLPAGSYLYKIKTQYGIQTRFFYKL